MDIARASIHEYDSVKRFYTSVGYCGPIDPTDTILLAIDHGEIVGAVRLCQEEEQLVLRGMQVAPPYQRKGIGTRLLEALLQQLETSACFCIPFRHLETFYRQGGFEPISPSETPTFLNERLRHYRAKGKDVLVMGRKETQHGI